MTAQEKNNYLEQTTIGYWSACGGMEVKKCEFGIYDYIIFVANAWHGNKSVHRCKIYYNDGQDYIKFKGDRYYINDCIRC